MKLLKCRTANMSVGSAMVVLMLLIHGSFALKCYKCTSAQGGDCDGSLDDSKTETCPSDVNVCMTDRPNLLTGIQILSECYTFDLIFIQDHSTVCSIK